MNIKNQLVCQCPHPKGSLYNLYVDLSRFCAKAFQILLSIIHHVSCILHHPPQLPPLSLKSQQTLVYPGLIHDATVADNIPTHLHHKPLGHVSNSAFPLFASFNFWVLQRSTSHSESTSDMDTRKQQVILT